MVLFTLVRAGANIPVEVSVREIRIICGRYFVSGPYNSGFYEFILLLAEFTHKTLLRIALRTEPDDQANFLRMDHDTLKDYCHYVLCCCFQGGGWDLE